MTVYQATRDIKLNGALAYALGAVVPGATVTQYRFDLRGLVQAVPPAVMVPVSAVGIDAALIAAAADATAKVAAQHTADNATYERVVGVPAPTGVAATDTANLQAAITTAKAASVYRQTKLRFNFPGVYAINAAIDFGSLVVESVSFAAGFNFARPFGDAGWTSGIAGLGSVVLQSSMTSGDAFTRAAYGEITNVVLLGPGSGTSVGLASPVSGIHMRSRNLVVANFSVGLKMTGCYFNLYDDIRIQGNGTGVLMTGAVSSVNKFTGGEFRDNNIALEMAASGVQTGGASNLFESVTFQYNTGKGLYLHGSGGGNNKGNKFDACWFENPAATLSIHVAASSDATIFEGCFHGTEPVQIDANGCAILWPGNWSSTLTNTGIGNNFLGRFYPGPIVDTGTNTALLDPYALTKFGTVVGTVSTLTESARAATAALTSDDLNRMQACTLTSAGYTLTLPTPVGVAGQQIGVRVTAASTKLLTVATAAGNIDGQATRIMWAGESAVLQSDGTNWVKIAGRTIPMTCTLRMNAALAILTSTITTATLDTTVTDNTGLMATLGSNAITVRRPGNYHVMARPAMDQPATTCTRFIALAQKNGSTVVIQQETSPASGSSPVFAASDDVAFAAADTVQLQAFQVCITPATRNFGTGTAAQATALTVREIPTW